MTKKKIDSERLLAIAIMFDALMKNEQFRKMFEGLKIDSGRKNSDNQDSSKMVE